MMQLAKQEQIAKFQSFLKTSIFWTLEATLKETRNSSKIRPLDFEKKGQLNSEKCSAKYQWTYMRISPLC